MGVKQCRMLSYVHDVETTLKLCVCIIHTCLVDASRHACVKEDKHDTQKKIFVCMYFTYLHPDRGPSPVHENFCPETLTIGGHRVWGLSPVLDKFCPRTLSVGTAVSLWVSFLRPVALRAAARFIMMTKYKYAEVGFFRN